MYARCFLWGAHILSTPGHAHAHAHTHTHTHWLTIWYNHGTPPIRLSADSCLMPCHPHVTLPLYTIICVFWLWFFFVLLNQDHSDSSSKHLLQSSSWNHILTALSFLCYCTKVCSSIKASEMPLYHTPCSPHMSFCLLSSTLRDVQTPHSFHRGSVHYYDTEVRFKFPHFMLIRWRSTVHFCFKAYF